MKNFILFLGLVYSVALYSQEKFYVNRTNNETLGGYAAKTDSAYFNTDASIIYFSVAGVQRQLYTGTIDSITFGSSVDTIIRVVYNGTTASVFNPLAFEGVVATVNGADVRIVSSTETKDIYYSLSGSTSNGSFKIYSEKRFNLLMDGVEITNEDGPAINIQSKNRTKVTLLDGTSNALTDGVTYAAAETLGTTEEDQKAAFFSEGKIQVEGTGTLTVNGVGTGKHAICTDDEIEINAGTIIVTSALNDGIHAKSGVKIHGGTVNVNSTNDGIDAGDSFIEILDGAVSVTASADSSNGITCDSILAISGGTVDVNVKGVKAKGLKSSKSMSLTGGTISVNVSGGIALVASGSGYDASASVGIKCDSVLTINGATLSIANSGAGGKGISCDTNIYIISGTIDVKTTGKGSTYKNSSGTTDSYSPSCLTSDQNISITGGTITLSSNGAGGKGISLDGALTFGDGSSTPTLDIKTSGAKFTVTSTGTGRNAVTDYCHPKAIVATGAITINSGTITISSTDDGIHSEASVTQNNGSVTISSSVEGVESLKININGGTISVTSSNDGFNGTAGTVSGGAEYDDGSVITFNGGTVIASCTNGDAIDCNGSIVMNGGIVIANGPMNGVEEACDFNGNFSMKGGFFIGAGSNSNMTKSMTANTSTQANFFLSTSTVVSSSTLFHIQDASGKDVVTFKPQYGGYKFLFSSSALVSGSVYTVYTGGSYSGGTSVNGLYTGGTYTAGTKKKDIPISSMVTSTSF